MEVAYFDEFCVRPLIYSISQEICQCWITVFIVTLMQASFIEFFDLLYDKIIPHFCHITPTNHA